MVAFGALSGGVGAELSGGNFWQGAVTGGIVAGLNHAMHKTYPPDKFKGRVGHGEIKMGYLVKLKMEGIV